MIFKYVALGSEFMSSFFAVVIRLCLRGSSSWTLCGVGLLGKRKIFKGEYFPLLVVIFSCCIQNYHLKLLSIVVSVFCDMRKHLKTLICTSFYGFEWCQKSLREGHCDSVVHVYYHHALWASPRGVGTSPDKGIVQVHTLIFVRLLTKLLLMLHACHLGAIDHSASALNFVVT